MSRADKEKIAQLKREIANKDRALADRNRQLDAMAWVWCDGGCPSGVFRHTPIELTEQTVQEAERNVERLRRWYENAEHKRKWQSMTSVERYAWFNIRGPAKTLLGTPQPPKD
jgi:hypothetical protein